GADLQHPLNAGELRDLRDKRNHVRLRDRLRLADWQGPVVICMVLQFGGKETMARHRAHRIQHTLIRDAATRELLADHLLARICEIVGHMSKLYYADRRPATGGPDYDGAPPSQLCSDDHLQQVPAPETPAVKLFKPRGAKNASEATNADESIGR